jgi:putative intracellular protease/amidase
MAWSLPGQLQGSPRKLYTPVIANPKGDTPVMDANSNNKKFFGGDGYVQFYPVNALAEAGAHVDTFTNWHRNVVVDRELITGQQPMFAEESGNALVAKLNGSSR